MNQAKSVETSMAVFTAFFEDGKLVNLSVKSKKQKKLSFVLDEDEVEGLFGWLMTDVLGSEPLVPQSKVELVPPTPQEIKAIGLKDPNDPLSLRRATPASQGPSRPPAGVVMHDLSTPEGQKKFLGQ